MTGIALHVKSIGLQHIETCRYSAWFGALKHFCMLVCTSGDYSHLSSGESMAALNAWASSTCACV